MRLLTAFMLLTVGFCSAATFDFSYLTFQNTDGTKLSVPVDGLEITYNDGQLTFVVDGKTTSLEVSDLNKMFFTNEPAGINGILANEDGQVDIYTLTGIAMGHYTTIDEARSVLPRGIYVAKSKNQNSKIVVL